MSKISKSSKKEQKPQKAKRRTAKIKFAVYMNNNGDGSASPRFFANEKLAEEAASQDDERFCDDVSSHEFVIDLETGTVISGIASSVPKED